MALGDDRSFNDTLFLNRFFDKRHEHRGNDINIIPECQLAYSKLSKKQINIHLVSNYDDQYIFILIDHLSQQNIDIIEEMIVNDPRYFYNNDYNKYGIRVSCIGDDASFELAELTDIFYTQKSYQKTLVRVN